MDFTVWVSTLPHDFPIKEWGRRSSSSVGRAQPFAGRSLAEQDMPWLAFFGNPSHPQAQQGEIRTACFIFKFPCFLGHQPDPLFFEYSCLWFNFLWVVLVVVGCFMFCFIFLILLYQQKLSFSLELYKKKDKAKCISWKKFSGFHMSSCKVVQ